MQQASPYLKTLTLDGEQFSYYALDSLSKTHDIERLPFAAKILLENLLRHSAEEFVQEDDINKLATWDINDSATTEIAFVPSRVVLQDFTGVPAVVDLAAMRDAMVDLGGDPQKINPLKPVELVIDHSVMVDYFAEEDALDKNTAMEVQRNKERYQFLRWGQQAFDNFKVVPPGKGIVHQVNLEYLARVTFIEEQDDQTLLYPDTLVGTDSHTTMINGLGILGWGVGGIEAEAAMLGQPVTMLIPEVVGMEITGSLPPGTTATDLVLTITQKLREFGVVGKFVEFYGDGVKHLTIADRATIANMAPEYGATCGIFPLDEQTETYLRLTGRDNRNIDLIKAYAQAQGMWGSDAQKTAVYHANLHIDLGDVVTSIAGPKRPQDRIALSDAAAEFDTWLSEQEKLIITTEDPEKGRFESEGGQQVEKNEESSQVDYNGQKFSLNDGAVVIAAITSCTNTSNPSVLIAAGLLAKKASEMGLSVKPWVKTSFAPGSQVVTEYLNKANLTHELENLGFHLVGYGCTTCIGNSGPLPEPISAAIRKEKLNVTSVLSGNRNFEGRIHSDVKANYLASPPLVIAYALAGNMHIDLLKEPLGTDKNGKPVYLRDIWPSNEEIQALVTDVVNSEMFSERYSHIFEGDETWNNLDVVDSEQYNWPESTYVKKPTFFDGITQQPEAIDAISNARCLLKLGDTVTTDHISPAGSIAPDGPAAQYLRAHGVEEHDFNSFGSRRGNHEIMMRGTFANVRLKNQLAPGTEGGWTRFQPSAEQMSVFDAAMKYQEQGTPSIVIAGKEYGTGSSRDWAAKGPLLLGVKAVIAESYERIHRSNLIGMGILPLQFKPGDDAQTLKLDGTEQYSISAIEKGQKEVCVSVKGENGEFTFDAQIRIDTPNEFSYFSDGGILQYVLRSLNKKA
ncbi:aconitate hydratase AcnA [Paraglaciecola chathamensis]|jgi:aconitate hydratase|uniref:Aconitate hydratase n=2 Tax=Paraglaciecola chathamensis TaxID=368405 RepID=A0ABQ0IA47_9ALTE|nr:MULTISPECIES: aconitate hydratase AcnA [Paraglaciecola]GAC06123.1 aconitate hydratase 1 [Paraglaciecola agarilytica NO2]GAC10706.1 aconitate hydratase 1 [Paraglaciecola chathamensis S18K6]